VIEIMNKSIVIIGLLVLGFFLPSIHALLSLCIAFVGGLVWGMAIYGIKVRHLLPKKEA